MNKKQIITAGMVLAIILAVGVVLVVWRGVGIVDNESIGNEVSISTNEELEDVKEEVSEAENVSKMEAQQSKNDAENSITTTQEDMVRVECGNLNPNLIESVELALKSSENICRLSIYSNEEFDKFVSNIELFPNLKELRYEWIDYRGQKPRPLPPSLSKLTNLEVLSFYWTGIQEAPSELSKLKSLKKLDLGANNFKNVPKFVYGLDRLQHLSLVANPISEISPKISNLQSLKVLNLAFTDVLSLPSTVGNLNELQGLDLRVTLFTSQTLVEELLSNFKRSHTLTLKLTSDKLNKIYLSPSEQDELRKEFPNIEFEFDSRDYFCC